MNGEDQKPLHDQPASTPEQPSKADEIMEIPLPKVTRATSESEKDKGIGAEEKDIPFDEKDFTTFSGDLKPKESENEIRGENCLVFGGVSVWVWFGGLGSVKGIIGDG